MRGFALACGLVVAVAGCGSNGPTRYRVSGEVTFRGTPLDAATIQFVSREESAGSAVTAGGYEVPAAHGLPAGSYQVVISCPVRPRGVPADRDYLGLYDELLPASANTATVLTAEVTAEGPNRFDFRIE